MCDLDATFEDSGYVIPDTLIYSMMSAYTVQAVNDYIETTYCEKSSDYTFKVGSLRKAFKVSLLLYILNMCQSPI